MRTLRQNFARLLAIPAAAVALLAAAWPGTRLPTVVGIRDRYGVPASVPIGDTDRWTDSMLRHRLPLGTPSSQVTAMLDSMGFARVERYVLKRHYRVTATRSSVTGQVTNRIQARYPFRGPLFKVTTYVCDDSQVMSFEFDRDRRLTEIRVSSGGSCI